MTFYSNVPKKMSDNGLDLGNETIDPRVQVELERLNSATDDINKLEVDLDAARDTFRSLLCESAARLDALSRKLGSCIEKARPYYEARMRATQAAREAQDAAVQYERANSAHSAAREMVYLAEQGLGGKCTLDPAWQEMLNHATQRVNEAESARAHAGAQHLRAGKRMGETSALAQKLQRELRKSIAKSRPYFEMKAQFNQQLELQKIKVQALEKQVCNAKLTYADALRHLEQISDEIHRNRKKSKQYFEIDFKQEKSKFKFIENPPVKKLSDPIASFPEYPYVESTSVFYNQTYIPESNHSVSKNCTMVNNFDEYKRLPTNISPKSSPIKVKEFPEEIQGYHGLPMINSSETSSKSGDEQNVAQLPKSLTNEWTEINLDSSSPEELTSDTKNNDIPYERFDDTASAAQQQQEVNKSETTPKKRLLTKQMTLPATSSAGGFTSSTSSSFKSKMKLDSNLTNWISRSSAKNDDVSSNNSSRRQSLDNILGPTSEKVKEIFSHGIMMLNISSLTERRNSEPKCSNGDSGGGAVVDATAPATNKSVNNTVKKVPSPLEKTLTYLTSNADEDTTGSDTDSLASCDMLTDEQIQSLMLDRDIDLVCEQMFGTPISDVCPKFGANQIVPTAVTTEASSSDVILQENN